VAFDYQYKLIHIFIELEMKYITALLLTVLPFCGISKDWNKEKLLDLDKEQFRRLENGEKQLEEIPRLIIQKSGKQPNKYLINAYTLLGIVNKNKGFYVSALNYNLLALSASERLKDQGRISACLNNIGTLYLLQENYKKAISFFERSLKLEESLNNPEQKSIRFYNLGDAYKRLNQLDEAMGYFTSSLLIERKLKNKIGIAYALLGQADVYLKTKRNSDVTAALQQIVYTDLDEEGKIEFFRISGTAFRSANNLEMAIKTFLKGTELANKTGSKTQLADLFLLLAQTFELQKNLPEANRYYKRHIQVYKALQSNLIKNQLEDLTYQNELQQKELKIVYLKKQQELAQQNALAQQRLRSYDWRIVLFSVVSLIGIVITVIGGMKKIMGTQK